jgi:predicted nuclease of predicted toxin-antitoxin system
MKILIDMNLSPKWVEIFLANNINSIHWSSIGHANASDEEIIIYAKDNDYAVFTHDLDFSSILAITHSNKPSVIQIRTGDISPVNSAQLVISAIKTAYLDIEKGALVTIDLNKTRLRILPLKDTSP